MSGLEPNGVVFVAHLNVIKVEQADVLELDVLDCRELKVVFCKKTQQGRRLVVKKTSLIVIVLGIAGCVSQTQILDDQQGVVIQTAVKRAQFKISCPDAAGIVLSREVIQPTRQGIYIVGVERTEYMVGVTGCGKKDTYVVVCPVGSDGCFAADSRNR